MQKKVNALAAKRADVKFDAIKALVVAYYLGDEKREANAPQWIIDVIASINNGEIWDATEKFEDKHIKGRQQHRSLCHAIRAILCL